MKRVIDLLKNAASRLWSVPFRLCLGVAMLLHCIGEEYPFSNFPMYSNFQRDARVVWVADQNGDPVPTNDYFGRRASTIKKIFDTRMSEMKREAKRGGRPIPPDEEAAREAAALVLAELWKGRRENRLERAGITELRFLEQNIRFEGDQFVETEIQLAVRPMPTDGN